jgi:pyruvate formate lyase activating enzyme
MRTGLVFNVQKYSIHDGPGIRTTVFLKGCPLSCWWCHNPESIGREPFVHYDRDRCLGCQACVRACPEGALHVAEQGIVTDPARCRVHAACVQACPAEARRLVGRRVSVAELLDDIERDRLYYEESGGGVTFSGGEPLLQWEFLLDMLAACGKRDIHRTVDTTGVAPADALLRVAEETDLFLYDLKLMDPELHRRATGVRLSPILANLARLLAAGARVQIRVPLIPGVTSDDGIERTGAFLASLPAVEGVSLLPFHQSARDKHRKFGVPWRLESHDDIPADRVAAWAASIEHRGLRVSVGG